VSRAVEVYAMGRPGADLNVQSSVPFSLMTEYMGRPSIFRLRISRSILIVRQARPRLAVGA
jgi:hypothetical protein